MGNNYCVYKHTSPSGKIYIGITSQLPCQRWARGKGYRNNYHFYNAIQKYGWDAFSHEILFENISREEAEKREIELIEFYDCLEPKGYNRNEGGNLRNPVSDETRKKLSESHKGLTHICPEDAKIRIGNANRGRVMPESARKILSEKHMGMKGSEKQRQAARTLCESRRGKLHPHYGKPSNHRKKVKAINIDTLEEKIFESVADAANVLSIKRTDISTVLSGRQKTCHGYRFEEVTK